jgi:hypothetical protein
VTAAIGLSLPPDIARSLREPGDEASFPMSATGECGDRTEGERVAIVIAQDWEKAARQKRTMRQTQKIIDRLHEMISGERIARLSIMTRPFSLPSSHGLGD